MTNSTLEANTTEATVASATAVIRCLPAPDLNAGAPISGESALASAVGAAGSKAVSASIAGAVSGTLVIVLAAELAAMVESGPVGPQELVAGLEPALTDATASLAAVFGDIRHEAAQGLDAEVAVATSGGANSITVVPINNDAGQVGAVVAMINLPQESNEDTGAQASFEALSGTSISSSPSRAVELLNDVEMGVTAELGRTRMTVRELLSIQPGSVVELDRAAGSPVDLLVNGTLVARGEVVVVDEEFGVRITEIIGYDNKKNVAE